MNNLLKGYDPITILLGGFALAYLVSLLLRVLLISVKFSKNFRQNVSVAAFNFAVWLPCGRHYLQKEKNKAIRDFSAR